MTRCYRCLLATSTNCTHEGSLSVLIIAKGLPTTDRHPEGRDGTRLALGTSGCVLFAKVGSKWRESNNSILLFVFVVIMSRRSLLLVRLLIVQVCIYSLFRWLGILCTGTLIELVQVIYLAL
ncbi:hypothetical protein HD806DRAFT_493593 [Xylariaceae sp. AK1471]|nr:hypothetical protein HD806DRAFT_493593 [Xylariaceae sp. AK1471]